MSKLPQSILDKIQKLYALSGNNPNEHEAASAATKCQEMLKKYNLTLDTVLLKQETVECKQINPDYAHEIWVAKLAVVLAKEFNCGIFTSNESLRDELLGMTINTKAINFYGLPSDIEVLNYTFIYLHRTILSLLMREKDKSVSFRKNFASGIITELSNKFYAARKARENNYTTKENEIMVVKDGLVKQYAKENLSLSYSSRSPRQNHDAFSAGQNAGRNINMSQGIKGGNGGGRYLV